MKRCDTLRILVAAVAVVVSRALLESVSRPPENDKIAVQAAVATSQSCEHHQVSAAPNSSPHEDNFIQRFNDWIDQYLAQSTLEATKDLIEEGRALAQIRRSALLALIQENPRAALDQALPQNIRRKLPVEVVELLESPVHGSGQLTVSCETYSDPALSSIRRHFTLAEQTYETYLAGSEESIQTTCGLALRGIAIDGHLAAVEEEISSEQATVSANLSSESESSGQFVARQTTRSSLSATAASSGTSFIEKDIGERTLLLMTVDFTDKPGNPETYDQASELVQEVKSYFERNSFHQLTFAQVVVTPLLHLPYPSSVYYNSTLPNPDTLLTHARAMAREAGYPVQDFDFDVVYFPNIGFPWLGRGLIGARGAWLQGALSLRAVCHELGHNMGLPHAGLWSSTETLGTGKRIDYGNPYDMMGTAPSTDSGHFNANFKAFVGWLPESLIHTANASGTYRIHAVDGTPSLNPNHRYAIRIPVARPLAGNFLDFWVELRATGGDANPDRRTLVFLGDNIGGSTSSLLLDTTPGSLDGTKDAGLAVGEMFTDSASGIFVTLRETGSDGSETFADIEVQRYSLRPDWGSTLELPHLVWHSGGNNLWKIEESDLSQQIVRSGSVQPGESSWIETVVHGPGEFSFNVRVQSGAGNGRLGFTISSARHLTTYTKRDWANTLYLSPGRHTLRWNFAISNDPADGDEFAILEDARFTPTPSLFIHAKAEIGFILELRGQPGSNPVLEYTENIAQGPWTQFGYLTQTNSIIRLIDHDSSKGSHRFYRLLARN